MSISFRLTTLSCTDPRNLKLLTTAPRARQVVSVTHLFPSQLFSGSWDSCDVVVVGLLANDLFGKVVEIHFYVDEPTAMYPNARRRVCFLEIAPVLTNDTTTPISSADFSKTESGSISQIGFANIFVQLTARHGRGVRKLLKKNSSSLPLSSRPPENIDLYLRKIESFLNRAYPAAVPQIAAAPTPVSQTQVVAPPLPLPLPPVFDVPRRGIARNQGFYRNLENRNERYQDDLLEYHAAVRGFMQ